MSGNATRLLGQGQQRTYGSAAGKDICPQAAAPASSEVRLVAKKVQLWLSSFSGKAERAPLNNRS